MARWRIVVALVALVPAGGCGGGEPDRREREAQPGESALREAGLTAALPDDYRAACAQLSSHPRLTATCPPVVPVGPLEVDAGRIDRSRRHRASFEIDAGSRSLADGAQRDPNAGHWTFTVGRGRPVTEALDWTLQGGNAGQRRPSSCRLERVAGERVRACRVVKGGGYYGGHVAYAWRDGELVYHLTAHGYRHDRRVRLMLANLIRQAGRP